MLGFINHLKNAVETGQLSLGVSTIHDWFKLLSLAELQSLAIIIDNLATNPSDVDYMAMLVYSLCQLEGVDISQHYPQNPSEAVTDFSAMLHLEILSRQGYFRFHQKLSFSNPDCEVEVLKPPPASFMGSLN